MSDFDVLGTVGKLALPIFARFRIRGKSELGLVRYGPASRVHRGVFGPFEGSFPIGIPADPDKFLAIREFHVVHGCVLLSNVPGLADQLVASQEDSVRKRGNVGGKIPELSAKPYFALHRGELGFARYDLANRGRRNVPYAKGGGQFDPVFGLVNGPVKPWSNLVNLGQTWSNLVKALQTLGRCIPEYISRVSGQRTLIDDQSSPIRPIGKHLSIPTFLFSFERGEGWFYRTACTPRTGPSRAARYGPARVVVPPRGSLILPRQQLRESSSISVRISFLTQFSRAVLEVFQNSKWVMQHIVGKLSTSSFQRYKVYVNRSLDEGVMVPGSRGVGAIFVHFSDEDSGQTGDAIGEPRVPRRSWSRYLSNAPRLADQLVASRKDSAREGGFPDVGFRRSWYRRKACVAYFCKVPDSRKSELGLVRYGPANRGHRGVFGPFEGSFPIRIPARPGKILAIREFHVMPECVFFPTCPGSRINLLRVRKTLRANVATSASHRGKLGFARYDLANRGRRNVPYAKGSSSDRDSGSTGGALDDPKVACVLAIILSFLVRFRPVKYRIEALDILYILVTRWSARASFWSGQRSGQTLVKLGRIWSKLSKLLEMYPGLHFKGFWARWVLVGVGNGSEYLMWRGVAGSCWLGPGRPVSRADARENPVVCVPALPRSEWAFQGLEKIGRDAKRWFMARNDETEQFWKLARDGPARGPTTSGPTRPFPFILSTPIDDQPSPIRPRGKYLSIPTFLFRFERSD
uniref:Uncharacterized protein n=1 Tax=Fagus sylvatica TaxID=28930 RepID=A0A2N9H6U9_FAGSY